MTTKLTIFAPPSSFINEPIIPTGWGSKSESSEKLEMVDDKSHEKPQRVDGLGHEKEDVPRDYMGYYLDPKIQKSLMFPKNPP